MMDKIVKAFTDATFTCESRAKNQVDCTLDMQKKSDYSPRNRVRLWNTKHEDMYHMKMLVDEKHKGEFSFPRSQIPGEQKGTVEFQNPTFIFVDNGWNTDQVLWRVRPDSEMRAEIIEAGELNYSITFRMYTPDPETGRLRRAADLF